MLFKKSITALNLAVFTLVISACSNSPQADVEQSKFITLKGLNKDVSIGVIEGTELFINIALPKKKSKTPRAVMLMLHSHGVDKYKKDKHNERLKKFASIGVVAASVSYRWLPEHKFPAGIEDVKATIRFIKAHAKTLNIDPNRIAISGSSKGGYLATMAGVTGNDNSFNKHDLYPEFDSSVSAVISFSGSLADFTQGKYPEFALLDRFVNSDGRDTKSALAAISPVTYLDKNDPPFFIAHGSEDDVVPVGMSRDFVAALNNINHDVNYVEIDGATHHLYGSQPQKASNASKASIAFFLLQTQ